MSPRRKGSADTQMAMCTDHACVVSLYKNLTGLDPEKLPGRGRWGAERVTGESRKLHHSPGILPSAPLCLAIPELHPLATGDTVFLTVGCCSKLGAEIIRSDSENKTFIAREEKENSLGSTVP